MKSYSKLEVSTTTEYKWHGLPQTDRTKKERAKVKALLDDFTSFEWRGVNAWDTFGAFIINERNSLKFFNGPTWSNEYSKPQFSSQSNQLTGMSFKTPSFGFTMGVYWFSDQDYRFLLDWLNPYEINSLSFGYDKEHYYQVKLASVSQGTRYFLGKETIIGDNGARTENKYYTEISLVFEIQGDNCAYNKDKQVISFAGESPTATLNITDAKSDLDFPFEVNLDFTLPEPQQGQSVSFEDNEFITLSMKYKGVYYELFSCDLQNLPFQSGLVLNFKYTSENGLVFWSQGESRFRLLSSLSTLSTGYRLIRDINTNIVLIPGRFNINYNETDKIDFYVVTKDGSALTLTNSSIIVQGRTNVI